MSFNSYYGNGVFINIVTVSRVTDKSIFTTSMGFEAENREAITTIQKYLDKGMWKPIIA